jgi:hypothetical protein
MGFGRMAAALVSSDAEGVKRKEELMYHWMNGWSWLWMSFMMVFWVVVLGAVVFIAVRLAQRPPREGKR